MTEPRTLAPPSGASPRCSSERLGAYDADHGRATRRPGRPASRPVLHARRGRALGWGSRRAALPAARVLVRPRAPAPRRRRRAAVPARGRRPGHAPARPSSARRGACAARPARARFDPPADGPRRCSWAAASAAAPLLCLHDELRAGAPAVLLGFRSAAHAEAAALFAGERHGRPPTTARSGRHGAGHRAAARAARRRAAGHGLRLRPAGDARGGAGPLRRARRCRPSWRSSRAWPAASAPASAAWSRRGEGYMRVCVDGPGVRRPRWSG